jgi:hypothetical protein
MTHGRHFVFALFALLGVVAGSLRAQERLPAVDSPIFDNPPLLYDPVQPAAYPGDLSQPVVQDYITNDPGADEQGYVETDDGFIVPQEFSHITKTKDGFFQKLYLADTYIPRNGDNGLGMNDAEVALSVALPLPTRRHPVVITPGFTTHFLDGPANTDLPPRLYDAYVAFNWYPRFTRNWGAIISITPTLQTDFEKWDDQAFRTPGKALLRYTWAQFEREIVFGVIYLDRDDVPWLPAAGLIWTPNPYVSYDLVFPRPRVLFMFNQQPEHEDWAYIAGEFGGGSWSIQRVPSATQDVVTFADYRVIVGVERRRNGGAGMRVEAGYVFGRSFEYTSTSERFEPEDEWMVRGSVSF